MPVSVFSLFLSLQKRNTKQSPIDVPIFDDFYGPKEAPGVKELGQKSPELSTRVEGAPYPLGSPYLVDDLKTPPGVRPTPKILINTETPEKKPRSGVPSPQASVATKNQSGPCSGTLPQGGIRWLSSSSRWPPR